MYNPYAPSSTQIRRGPSGPTQKLQERTSHVVNGWFPVNPEALWTIKSNLKTDVYQLNPEQLVKDIKRDQAVLGICFKNFQRLKKDDAPLSNPLSDIGRIDANKLRALLDLPESSAPEHSIKDASKAQAMRLKQSLTACAATEEMAARAEIDKDLAYSCAYFQQMTLNLIAWNYPDIFIKIVAAQRRDSEDPDRVCRQLLGVSLSELSSSIVKDWDLSPELRAQLEQGRRTYSPTTINGKLERIVELGKAYAEAQEGHKFPKMLERWQSMAEEASQYLSADSLDKISQQVETYARPFMNQIPAIFEEVFHPPEQEETKIIAYGLQLLKRNTYASRCGADMGQIFEELYGLVEKGGANSAAINILVNVATPRAGFLGGCIYALSSERVEFEPILTFGPRSPAYFKSVQTRKKELLLHALQSLLPIKHDLSINPGEAASLISAAILGTPKPAVLCLELSREFEDDIYFDPMKSFKAIRRCWEDCLGLA